MQSISGIPVYNFSIDDFDEELGVSTISFVDDPAVEKNFIALSKSAFKRRVKTIKLSLNEEKRIVTGVALRADFPIYRRDEDGKEYFLTVSKDEMHKIMVKFMREKRTDSVNLMHDDRLFVDNVFLIESFIFTKKHKLIYPEFSDVEHGSWMVSYKVNNDNVWALVKNGTLKGFSVEMLGFMLGKEPKDNELLKCLINYFIYEQEKES